MASGDTLLVLLPAHAVPDPTNPPGFGIRGNYTPVWTFDDTTDESVYFLAVMPGQYDGTSNLVFKIGAVHATDGETATAGEFEISIARFQDDNDDIETPTFDTVQNLTWTSASANDEIAYDTLSISNANMDGIQPNEAFMIKVTFDGSVWTGNGGAGDVQLVTLEIQEA